MQTSVALERPKRKRLGDGAGTASQGMSDEGLQSRDAADWSPPAKTLLKKGFDHWPGGETGYPEAALLVERPLPGPWGSGGPNGPTRGLENRMFKLGRATVHRPPPTRPPASPDVTPDVVQATGDTIRDLTTRQE